MKSLILLTVVIAVSSAGVLKDLTKGYEDGDRYFYFPDSSGKLHLVDTLKPIDVSTIKKSSTSNIYWLFTRKNPSTPQLLTYRDVNSIKRSNFDLKKKTVFLAHGWGGDLNSPYNKVMTEAFLDSTNVNVVVLDWHALADQDYLRAKRDTPVAGQGLGEFINWLATLGASYNNMHLVGFSLGAHLVGSAGRETGGRVARITALDPAGPLWAIDNNRVAATDGKYVEVIHTNTALFGITAPSGDADFYPNGGSIMPGCIGSICSHDKSYEYMAATLRYNHLSANKCNSHTQAVLDRCKGTPEPMGNSDLRKTSSGIFRVNTAKDYPF